MLENGSPRSNREAAGLIIIIIGFVLLMNTMNFFPFFPFADLHFVHRFWAPALFIGIGVLLISRRSGQDRMGAGLFFIVLGVFFLLGGMDRGFKQWIGPALLIWIGVAVLMRNQRSRAERAPGPPPPPPGPQDRFDRPNFDRPNMGGEQHLDSSDFVHATVILGALNRRCPSQQFRGGDLTAIMG